MRSVIAVFFLGQDGRIRGDSTGKTAAQAIFQLGQIGGIHEQLHRRPPSSWLRIQSTASVRLVAQWSGWQRSALLKGVSIKTVRQPTACPATTSLQRSPTKKLRARSKGQRLAASSNIPG